MRRISKGLNLPIEGDPDQSISNGPVVRSVALIGPDFVGLKPTMAVAVGDEVRTGDLLFTDKKTPGVRYTAPACGRITEINRGERRAFQSLVIEITGEDVAEFDQHADLLNLDQSVVREQLLEAGLWPALRTRPFSKVAAPDSDPHSIFVTAIDSNPLAADPAVVIAQHDDLFTYGLQILTRVANVPVYLCKRAGMAMGGSDIPGVTTEIFDGPHPIGLPGTHIHMIDPVSEKKTVWYIGYQDVIAIGHLFTQGRLMTDRVVALGGPSWERPRLVRTRLGACVDDLTAGELSEGTHRVISGCVLNGRHATGPFRFLGRYHVQVSVIAEGGDREFLGWQKPGFDKFSIKRVFASALSKRKFAFTTDTGGSKRAMVPIGMYEHVMPLDIIPTYLLRSLIVGDTEQAQALGCLELDEEDLALCTFVCPGKYEYGSLLREQLTEIEKEG